MEGWRIILGIIQFAISFIAGWQVYDWIKNRRTSEGDTP